MRLRRLPGIVGLGVRRVWGRLTGPTPGRTLTSVAGVAIAVTVLVVVTGLALGLVSAGTVASEDVDYWIVPDEQGVGNTPLAYEGASLGAVHSTADSIRQIDGVTYATPVAIRPLQLTPPNSSDRTYVLALGIVADEGNREVANLDTGALTPGDPFYANGSYNGTWTGELVASQGVKDQLNVSIGTRLDTPNYERSFAITSVPDGTVDVGAGTVPVVVAHLAELQAVTNTTASDQADQILVATDDSGVRNRLDGIYPRTSVETRSGFSRLSPEVTSLPFAMAVAAGIVALVTGVAFVGTMMGLELTATRQSLAVFQAVGYTRTTMFVLVVTETLVVALLGGLVGVGLGWLTIMGLNLGVAGSLDIARAAVFDPLLIAYGLAAAVAVALVSVIYPVYIAWRTNPLEELTR
jgi:putative ABC transport system permease protein